MKRLLSSTFAFCMTWSVLVAADDTDIYLSVGGNPAAPHLMLMFDYRTDMAATFCSANGSGSCANTLSAYPDLLAALESIVGVGNSADNISALLAVFQVVFAKFDGIYVGLMMPNKDNGGTILRGFEEFQAGDANGSKAELISILQSIPVNGSGAGFFHDVAQKETHYEFFRYLNGQRSIYGRDTANNFQGTATPDYDPNIILPNGDYISPFSTPGVDYSCTKLYEIYATSGNAGGNVDDDLDSRISVDMSPGATDAAFNGMVSYLSNNDLVDDALATGNQNLKMWFIQMGSSASSTDDWSNEAGTIDQYMNVGGGNVDLFDVQTTLEATFIEALSVSSTFVSASVPVNVFNRIQTLDNFYIALFEANSTERWPGNIKKLKLVDTNSDGKFDDIADVNGISAFNDNDGRIKFESLSYWTDPLNLPPADPDEGEVTNRDGRTVDRGGAGQKIPGFISGSVGSSNGVGTRQLYVEPASGSTFNGFNVDLVTASALQSLLGAADPTEAAQLIAWSRGLDIKDEDGDGVFNEARPWLLGDAIHSRPLALNYGATGTYTEDNPNIRLFMGTNDGFFHIFENTLDNVAGSESGREVFAFIPRESLDVIKPLYDNLGANPHPYGVDGEPVALVVDSDNDGTIESNSGEEVYVYVGMRRGGKSYYALNVSDPSAVPSLAWKITKTSGGDFDELGYTFSTPRVIKVNYNGTPVDALIFAGGYDLQKDTDTGSGRDPDAEGNAIYIVNARTGALIWKAKKGSSPDTNNIHYHDRLDHAIPSTVAVLDSDTNGVVDRAYVGDSSGIVWRIDLPEGDGSDTNHRRDNWEINKFADMDDSAEADDRRFFHAPDIVQTRDAIGLYDGVIIQSGDRASPLETTDNNFVYLIKDRNTASGSFSGPTIDDSALADVTGCEQGTEPACAGLNTDVGWRINLNAAGEKGLSSPIVTSGTVFFTSYQPNVGSSCAPNEGSGKLYAVNLADGTAKYDTRSTDIGPGIPPAVTAIGSSTLIIPGTGIIDPFDTTGSQDKTKLIQAGGKSVYIIYWREAGMDAL